MSGWAGLSLQGRVALVTGGTRGLGFEMSKALAASGALVLLNGRDETVAGAAAARISETVGPAIACPFDIADPIAAATALAKIGEAHGQLDILINNVGVRDRRGLFDFTLDDLRRLLEVDLVAPFHLAREAAKLMMPRQDG